MTLIGTIVRRYPFLAQYGAAIRKRISPSGKIILSIPGTTILLPSFVLSFLLAQLTECRYELLSLLRIL